MAGCGTGNGDMSIVRGATYQRTVTWKDSDGNPINLTGRSGRLVIRPTYAAAEPLAVLTTPAGGLTFGGVAGTIVIRIGADVTETFPVGMYVFDLAITLDADPTEVDILFQGNKATVHASAQDISLP